LVLSSIQTSIGRHMAGAGKKGGCGFMSKGAD